MNITLTIDMPETALSAIRKSPSEFAAEMRLAAAVKWYELGMVSQEKAAEIAGLTRADFILALGRFYVSPFQSTAEEIKEDLDNLIKLGVQIESITTDGHKSILKAIKK